MILGCTNPLFLKTLEKFPNILHLEKNYEHTLKQKRKIGWIKEKPYKK